MRLCVSLVALIALQVGHAQSSPTSRVEVRMFQFAPDTLRVNIGTKVVWTNQDEIEHTVTAGTVAERDAAFNAVLKTKGAAAVRTFDTLGTVTYFCDRHQFMRGSITVTR
ncbi:MAG: cupredoxin domain-containing protein [Gemmatimonadaceae bacterium]